MKYLKFFLVFILILTPITVVRAEKFPTAALLVDGVSLKCDSPPVIVNDRTMVPVRAISELNGADIIWNGSDRSVEITYDDVEIRLIIDNERAYINRQKHILDSPAMIINDRTMVPVRFVAEAFGYEVDWDAKTKTVLLNSPPEPEVQPEPEPEPVPETKPAEKPETKPGTETESESETSNKARLNTIGSAETEKGYRITIKFNSPITEEYSVFELSNPDRVIVDIKNAEIENSKQFSFKNSTVKSARAGNHDEFLRVVIDLSEKAKYTTKINSAKDALIFFFDVEFDEPGEGEENIEFGDVPSAEGLTIVIDPGHGGSDPGALGKENGKVVAYEDDVNLAVSLALRDILKEAGVNVIMTRETSVKVSLGARCTISNNAKADLFVSIHSNAMNEGYEHINGTMVFYGAAKDAKKPWLSSKTLASSILTNLCDAIATEDHGIQNGDELAVIRGTKAPAVLVELAFITNPQDRAKLTSPEYQKKAAQGIALGIFEALE